MHVLERCGPSRRRTGTRTHRSLNPSRGTGRCTPGSMCRRPRPVFSNPMIFMTDKHGRAGVAQHLLGAAALESCTEPTGTSASSPPRRHLVSHLAVAGDRVGEEDAFHALRVADGEGGGDRSAPVLADERDVAQVEMLDQRDEVLDVALQRVLAIEPASPDLPKPMWSGTTTRWPCDSGPIMWRYR